MTAYLASFSVLQSPWYKAALVVHLLLAVFVLGAVTYHWWTLVRWPARIAQLVHYAWWVVIGYSLVWLGGVLIYPTYNVMIRKVPEVGLEAFARWAVGLFEIKEHLGTIALVMLPWLVVSARRYARLDRLERISYTVGTWVFTIFVYYSFISGAVVTMVKGTP